MFSFLVIVAVLQFSYTIAWCNDRDKIVKEMELDGAPACRHCTCWGFAHWVCVVVKGECVWPAIQSEVCTSNKLNIVTTMTIYNEECSLCTCRSGKMICSPVNEASGNENDKKACNFTTARPLETTTMPYVKKYHIEMKKANWFMSNKYCLDHGMRFATISSMEENQKLTEMIKVACPGCKSTDWFWISGTNKGLDDKSFIWWSTGKPVTYFNWYPGEPSNITAKGESRDCLALVLYKELKWTVFYCSSQVLHFVCEY